MKTKFLLPVLAIIFATGMSFTTVELGDKVLHDYIRKNNQWESISEINCGNPGQYNCRVERADGVYEVYDTMNFGSLKITKKKTPFKL